MALPKDPNEIAESNIRSQNNLAQGQPTEFADNPNIQLASGFGASKLLNLFIKLQTFDSFRQDFFYLQIIL